MQFFKNIESKLKFDEHMINNEELKKNITKKIK